MMKWISYKTPQTHNQNNVISPEDPNLKKIFLQDGKYYLTFFKYNFKSNKLKKKMCYKAAMELFIEILLQTWKQKYSITLKFKKSRSTKKKS